MPRPQGPAAQTRTRVRTATVLLVSDHSFTVTTETEPATFVISEKTRVIGRATAMLIPPPDRRWRLTDAIRQGDRVTIEYREVKGTKHAIRIKVNPQQLPK
jgi:hypothetical protein